jgi:hypothetical protein
MYKLKDQWCCSTAFLWSLLIVSVTGCGSGFGEVSGTVTSRGQLVTSGTVLLLASDKLSHSGIIDDNGRYTIPKVPVGIAKIAVLSPGPDQG